MSRFTENLKKWANAPGPRLSRYVKTKLLSVMGIDPEQLSEDEIFALTTLAKEIPAELDQRKLLKEIIERAVTLLSGTTGGVYLLDAVDEDLKIEEDWGGSKSIRGHRLKIGQGLCGWVAQKKKARRVEDYSKFPDRSLAETLYSVQLTDETLSNPDCAVIVTDHSSIDYKRVSERASLIIDTRNAISLSASISAKVIKL